MRLMKWLFLALISGAVHHAGAASLCAEPKLTELAAEDARCYFYAGTAAYRAKDYKTAVVKWKALAALPEVPLELEYLRLSAYNNLGFVYFYGLAGDMDKQAALLYWKDAFKAGHDEAAYHLCHAYAVAKEPTYAPKLARGMCKEALRRFTPREEGDSVDETIADIEMHLSSTAQ
jgi:TPR repeat protein